LVRFVSLLVRFLVDSARRVGLLMQQRKTYWFVDAAQGVLFFVDAAQGVYFLLQVVVHGRVVLRVFVFVFMQTFFGYWCG
jgi:hypothetical protein